MQVGAPVVVWSSPLWSGRETRSQQSRTRPQQGTPSAVVRLCPDKGLPRPPMGISPVSSKGARRATPLAKPPMSAMIPDIVTREAMTKSRSTPRRVASTTRVRPRHSTDGKMLLDVRRLSKQSLRGGAHRLRTPPQQYVDNCTLWAKERQGTRLLASRARPPGYLRACRTMLGTPPSPNGLAQARESRANAGASSRVPGEERSTVLRCRFRQAWG